MIRHDDDAAPAGPTAVRDPETAVVARLQALSTQLDGEPDPAYRARARARLVAMAAVRTPEPARHPLRDRLLAARAVDRAPSRRRGRITAGLAGAAVGVTGLAALVAVAAGAGPGDPLYDLKRGTEQTQLALAGDNRGQTLLELARTRLEELRALADDRNAALVRQTLQTMDAQTAEGAALLTGDAVRTGDPESLDALAAWTAEQSTGLGALRGEVPADAGQDYADSAALLDALTARAAGLRTALACSTGPATVGDDDLGPVPGLCLTDAPPPVAGESPAAPEPAPAVPGTTTDPGSPPAADPGSPARPSTPARGTVGAPTVPGQTGRPSEAVPPPAGGILTPLPDLPLGESTADTNSPSRPPVVAVPAPAPLSICVPPLVTFGDC
ncbi:DUF5667 domain-containing protein [Blastococcus saxobsidens]|uniref:DUF5667 domain-containing protein n=1 Tax=Blastococcus saxobsidens TaxID=138336 RepID=UPI0002F54E35|nr:DUF5667 domain-containing protein [Blastococcus saxobsidens]